MCGLTKVCHFFKSPISFMKLSPHYISWHSLVFQGTNRDEETSWWQVWQVGDCAIELSGSGIVPLNDRSLSGNPAQIFLLPQSSPSLSNLLNCRSQWWLDTSKNIDSRTILITSASPLPSSLLVTLVPNPNFYACANNTNDLGGALQNSTRYVSQTNLPNTKTRSVFPNWPYIPT